MFLDLPLEIQHVIFGHCSPSDLAVLSRVHTSVRDVAEHALYSHVHYHAQPLDMVLMMVPSWNYYLVPWGLKEDRSLLHTFATNSRKASMVKAFYVELENTGDHNNNVVHFVLIKLAEALEKMSHLVDLRIVCNPVEDLSDGRISQVISSGYFKLHTLYLEHSHDLEGIIANQPQLRLLGIYFTLDILDVNRWTKIERLFRCPFRRRTMPVVFMLDCLEGRGPIHMLPSFHHLGEALQVWRETAASLNKWPDGLYGKFGCEPSLSLLGISEENISLLGETMGAMAACQRDYSPSGRYPYLKIIVHDKYIQKPWRFPEFVKPLELFDDIQALYIYFLDVEGEALHGRSLDLQLCLAKDLGRAWPTIQKIVLQGRMEDSLVLDRESGWTITTEEDEDHGNEYLGEDPGGGYDPPYIYM